jgi:hypothetical protein
MGRAHRPRGWDPVRRGGGPRAITIVVRALTVGDLVEVLRDLDAGCRWAPDVVGEGIVIVLRTDPIERILVTPFREDDES